MTVSRFPDHYRPGKQRATAVCGFTDPDRQRPADSSDRLKAGFHSQIAGEHPGSDGSARSQARRAGARGGGGGEG